MAIIISWVHPFNFLGVFMVKVVTEFFVDDSKMFSFFLGTFSSFNWNEKNEVNVVKSADAHRVGGGMWYPVFIQWGLEIFV